MDSKQFHTASSWCEIMLTHTPHLITEEDQIKFWNWMCNPDDSYNHPEVTVEKIKPPEILENYMVDGVEIQNTLERQGGTLFVKSTPIMPDRLEQSPDHQTYEVIDVDDEKSPETS